MADTRQFVSYWTIPILWPDATVFIIGGGPSLEGFDWDPFTKRRVIGCNDAYTLGPWVDVCFFCDYSWFKGTHHFPGHERLGLMDFQGLKVACVEHPLFDKRIKEVRRQTRRQGIWDQPDKLCWNLNTGATAINLAVHLGASRIVLLGFDMKLSPEGSMNWHENSKDRPNPGVFDKFYEGFKAVKRDLDERWPQVDVLNAGPDSDLDVFPFVDTCDILKEKPSRRKKRKVKTYIGPRKPKPPVISVLCPTRQRARMCRDFVTSFYEKAARRDALEIILYIDHDDPDMREYRNLINDIHCKMIVGKLGQEGGDVVGKAWNLMAREAKGEFLMMGNDDLFAVTQGWDNILRKNAKDYEDGIACFWFNDGIHTTGKHCAFPIVSREWYECLGYFMPECFEFFCHDTWVFDIGKRIGRLCFMKDATVEHRHFSTGKSERDSTTARNRGRSQNKHDLQTLNKTAAQRAEDAKKLMGIIKQSSDIYEYDTRLKNMLHGKTVALVGPAPTLMGKRKGKEIEQYDVVCRVNEFVPFGAEEDYGSRTDIVFSSGSDTVMAQLETAMDSNAFLANKLGFMVAAQLAHNDEGNVLGNFHRFYVKYGTSIHHVGDAFWHSLAADMGSSPTTGYVALQMLRKYKVKKILVAGFTFYADELKVKGDHPYHSPAYVEWGGEIDKSIPVKYHQMEPERQSFATMACKDSRIWVDSVLATLFKLDTERVWDVTEASPVHPLYHKHKQLAELVDGKRVAIVGPSPHLMGEGMGREIDGYDVVCRVNELLPFGCEEDYGSRTDIIFHCCGQYSIPKLEKTMIAKSDVADRVQLLVCPQDVTNDPRANNTPFHAIGKDYWWDLNRRVGAIGCATGLLSVALLLEKYRPKELLVTGFSFYSQGLEPEQRHNPGYIKWGGDHSAKQKMEDNVLAQNAQHNQAPQKAFFKKLAKKYHKKLRVDSFLSGLLHLDSPNVLQLRKRVYAIYRAFYGADFLEQSIRSIIDHVDKVFVFWTNKAFADVTECVFKGSTVKFPRKIDNVVEVAEAVREVYPDKVEVIFDHWGLPDNQYTHLFNDRVLPYHPRPDMVMFCEPDQVWNEAQLMLAFREMEELRTGVSRQIELWKDLNWRIPERPKRYGTIFWNLRGMTEIPVTGKGGSIRTRDRLDAHVHNLGFCVSPVTMFWKHLLAIAFSKKIGDSQPNEDWYFDKWVGWNENGNNKNLAISKGHEADIPYAAPYDGAGLPDVLK